jgi:hypothetical protein
MNKLTIKNWDSFQHYKDRCPPWVKLHKTLLDDFDYQCLPLASKALAPMLWLLASENMEGTIDACTKRLAFRLRWDEKDVAIGLDALIQAGFVIDASNTLATRLQPATPETETETETKKRASRFDAVASLSALGVNDQIARDWIKHRTTLKATVTQTVIDGVAREAAKARIALSDALAMTCERGWRGFKAEWVAEAIGQKANGYKSRADALAETARALTTSQPIERVINPL